MRGKTIHIKQPIHSYLILSILLVTGIVIQKWDVVTFIALALVFNSLIDLVEIREKPAPPTVKDEDNTEQKQTWRLGRDELPWEDKGSYEYKLEQLRKQNNQNH